MIVAAFAGTGKSYFAALHPDKAVDLECMPYKYLIDPEIPFDESNKANLELDMNPEWPHNYVEAILACPSDKIILIPSDLLVLHLLAQEKKAYYLCYPSKKAKKVYRKRYIKRGNSKKFLSIFMNRWELFMNNLRNDTYGKHIILQPNQHLSDVLDIRGILGQ